MDKFAIIVAGGTGNRMNSTIPKQFLLLCGKPVLMHSILAFNAFDPTLRIIVALHPGLFSLWETLCRQHDLIIPHILSPGGEKRFDTVKNALSYVTADGIVAVHDGVRPLLSHGLIQRAFDHAFTHGNAIPVSTVTDSVRSLNGISNCPLDRNTLRLIQTPQVFMAGPLLKSYEQAYRESFTDDASVLEADGHTISLIEGDVYNVKITYPEDLVIAESLMKFKQGY